MLSTVNKKIVLITTIVIIFVMYFLLDYYMFSVKQKNIIYGNDIIKIFGKNEIKFVLVKEFIEKEERDHPRGVIFLKSNTTMPKYVLNSREICDSWYYYSTDNV